ncbi:WYL domain-containing protein [Alteromonas sp. a30]|uniref:WYL domain-containing protein n=1 Tax=Alteromonas sp. a30 TaxID=2730917 RepID=UPI002281B300|nr:WYL domain-containing protein [Alteromonas sp. a30]MCY7296441.1 WYL domain-containing protein [Alteromonas sp. a30]
MEVTAQDLTHLSFAQKQRLSYIDFKLLFVGTVSRSEIVQHFELGLSAATRDINLYKALAANNIQYDPALKKYFITTQFSPLFEHDTRKTLVKLAHQISDGFDAINDTPFPVEAPNQLNVPDLFVVARLSQAIINQKPVNLIYTSLSSGSGAREFIPHSIIDNGLRWHVRGFDRKSQSFRDFVLTRISRVTVKYEQEVQPQERQQEDHQWTRIMPLQLVPHPKNIHFPTAIEMDFGMQNGVLELNVRAAMAGYLLRRWNVDCTEDASLISPEYQLYLRNRQTLYGAENLTLAPGYKASNE